MIMIDLEEETITFPDADEVFLCAKDGCNSFATEKRELLLEEHNRAAHDGIGPSFRPLSTSFYFSKALIYSLDPPENQFE